MTGLLKKIYFIDHYDSFSWNVVDWLRGDGTDFEIIWVSFDDQDKMAELVARPGPLVISPGPRHPLDATPTIEAVSALLGRVPVLGICLGHQILGHLAGFTVVRASAPFHGAALTVLKCGDSILFKDLPATFSAASYNSLVVSGDAPNGWRIDAVNETGEIQALSQIVAGREPAFGLQFHPESFMTSYKETLRRNWLRVVNEYLSHLPGSEAAPMDGAHLQIQTSATAPLSMPS